MEPLVDRREEALTGPERERFPDDEPATREAVLQRAGVLLIQIGVDEEEVHSSPPSEQMSSKWRARVDDLPALASSPTGRLPADDLALELLAEGARQGS